MRSSFAAGLLSLLAVSVSGLTDITIECERATCLEVAGNETVKLSCGDNGDVMKTILFASFGRASGACPSINDEEFEVGDVTLATNASCGATNSLAVVKALCEDKEECEFIPSEQWAPTDAGLGAIGCTNTDELFLSVFVECDTAFDVFQIAISLVIALIGLGMGATVEIAMLRRIFNEHKRALVVGVCSQFVVMPIISFIFVKALGVSSNVAAGMMIVGSSPGGGTSNLMTYWAHGSVALSITMSAVSTFCALFMMPLLIFLYIDLALDIGDDIKIPFGSIVIALLLVLLPALLGVYIKYKWPQHARKVELTGSGMGGLFVLAALVIGINQNSQLLEVSNYPNLWIAAMFLQPLGCLWGYCFSRFVAKLPHPECRAVCLEVGVQNTTLAISVIVLSFSDRSCDMVEILAYALIATLAYLINSIWITAFLRWVLAPRDDPEEEVEVFKDNEKIMHPNAVEQE